MKKSILQVNNLKKILAFFFVWLGLNSQSLSAENIGLLIVATGKYIRFAEQLIESAENYFCKEHQVTYFIFTDGELEAHKENVVCLYHSRLGWPFDTMMRFHAYYNYRDLLATQDYLFACDADMLFVGEVGNEILGERVATLHPGFVNQPGSYEKNPHSLAYIPFYEEKHYFAGGFYGGTANEVIQIAKINSEHIDDDLSRGIIAVWHDESHWNRYCIDYEPTVILSPSYCYPESWHLDYPKKLLALDKNHHEMRQISKDSNSLLLRYTAGGN